MAQTSVEWLQERYNQGNDYDRHLTESEFIQAKEMHKNEIIESYISGDNGYGPDNGIQESMAIDYYNEKYKQ